MDEYILVFFDLLPGDTDFDGEAVLGVDAD